MLTICSWCRRQRINGEWVITLPPPASALVSHGICEDCYRKQIEEIEEEQKDGR